jgi:hypothetical protein
MNIDDTAKQPTASKSGGPERAATGQSTSARADSDSDDARQKPAPKQGTGWPAKFRSLPHEDDGQFKAFERFFLLGLAANTPYEHELARTICRLSQEAKRLWTIREAIVLAQMKADASMGLLAHLSARTEAAKAAETVAKHVAALFGADGTEKTRSMHVLSKAGTSLEDLAARAYEEKAETLFMLHRQIADLETRQRRLYEEYMLLKANCAKPTNSGGAR